MSAFGSLLSLSVSHQKVRSLSNALSREKAQLSDVRFAIADLPGTSEGLAQWVEQVWLDKDLLLSQWAQSL